MASNCLSSALSLVNLTDVVRSSSGQVRDSRGWTVLHLAARHSKPQTVRLVIQQGGRLGERDEAGNTPLHLACESGNKEAARVLVHHGASLSDRNTAGLSPLHVAAKNGHSGVLEVLVQDIGGNNIDMVTTIGSRTALHIAASEGAEQVTQVLLNCGANPRARATSDWTPLHFSAREGNTEICGMLRAKGAKVNAVTTGGWTPLMLSAGFNRLETTSYLISAGANRMMTNNDGMSAEAIAAGKGFTRITSLLSGSNVSTPSTPTAQPVHSGASPSLPQQQQPATQQQQPATQQQEQVSPPQPQEEGDDEDEDISPEISGILEYLKPREVNKLIALKKEADESKKQMTENEAAFQAKIKSKESNLTDIQSQLEQAQQLEESLKKDLRKVSKDIDVLQRHDLDIRNEISTDNKHYHYSKSVKEKNVKECREKLSLFISEMKEKEAERRTEKESGARPISRPPSMSDGLHLESELECPICWELSRPPVYQCPEGHIICHKCRPRVSRCPVCRFVFKGAPEIRNRFIEKMSDYYFNMKV